MADGVEREIKLRVRDAGDARARVLGLGAAVSPLAVRRLQHDVYVDTPDRQLFAAGTALRVRSDGDRAFLTFKGPVQPGLLKVRQELETEAHSSAALLAILAALGYAPVFRHEKYREEFRTDGAVIAIDETPIGTFVEIEGDAAAIERLAAQLGFAAGDYVTESYRALFVAAVPGGADMVFDAGRR